MDDVLVDNPITWEATNTGLEFDPVNQITSINHDITHSWVGDVYQLFYDKWLANDICNLISLEIQILTAGTFELLYKGAISIPECVFHERRRVVDVKIKDDGFGARVENNKGIKVGLASTETKNGEPISSTSKLVFPFTPSTGTLSGFQITGYTVFEAFTFLVGWMTDNQVTFESDFFETGDGIADFIVSGVNLRNEGSDVQAPQISFQELYDQMRKMRNISMGFRTENGNPVLVIEDIDHFRTNANSILLNNIDETELSFDDNLLYSQVKIGSDILRLENCDEGNTNCDASNNVSYIGFDTEWYSLGGECTAATELDLTTNDPFIVDTNKVQDCYEFNNKDYDRRTFLIQLKAPLYTEADMSDPLGINENWYNHAYTNQEILARYQDYLTGTLTLFTLYNGLNIFSTTGNIGSGTLSPQQTPAYQNYVVPLNTEIYDPQNRFNLVNDRFTPVDEGVYQFDMGMEIESTILSPNGVIIFTFLNVEHYDAASTLIQKFSSPIFSYVTGDPAEMQEWSSEWVSMDSGDYCIFTIDYAQNLNHAITQGLITLGGVGEDQYFKCDNTRVAIADAQVNTGLKTQLALTSFKYPVDYTTMKSFLNDTTQSIRITSTGVDRTGYINSLNYNFVTGNAEVEILSNG